MLCCDWLCHYDDRLKAMLQTRPPSSVDAEDACELGVYKVQLQLQISFFFIQLFQYLLFQYYFNIYQIITSTCYISP